MAPNYRLRRAGRVTVSYVILIGAALLTLTPLAYAFFASFKSQRELLSSGSQLLPEQWTFENYERVWEVGDFAQYFANSVLVAVGVVILNVLGSAMLGYLLARRLVIGSRAIEITFGAVLFLGVGTATLYPRFIIAQQLGLDNLWGVILVEVSGIAVIHTFLVRAFAQTLPQEIEDAAKVDGAGLWRTFWGIVFPLLRPIVVTILILSFQMAWNNFQIPYVFTLGDAAQRTLVVGVYALRATDEGLQAYDLMLAGAMVIVVPIVIIFLCLQRYFIRGLVEGGVKG
ncbi:carbohydrate ABC transporter permease [Microbacterium awajiense]|uniref:Carbohydrate ABC transporter permease n=1 Tax=Microbacterium awajiense TaxID=415214 RepID=A0ABP7APU9_9MICO